MSTDLSIKTIGSFSVGGRKVTLAGLPLYEASMTTGGSKRVVDPNGDFWAEQMYAQYVHLTQPKAPYPLMLWHGGGLAGSCWESTPDRREGWQMFFLRAGHNVYVSDAVERGRASWARYPEIYTTEPVFRPYAHAWESFRIGPNYHSDPAQREVFPGSQYPAEAFDAAMMQAIPRWASNNAITQQAYIEYVKKVGPCVILAHSQACSFAMTTALVVPELVRGLILIEPSGTPNPQQEDLSKLKDIPHLFLWGDFLDKYEYWNKSLPNQGSFYKDTQAYFQALQPHLTHARWLELPDIGICGNTHMLIQDRNSDIIAQVIQDWLVERQLCN